MLGLLRTQMQFQEDIDDFTVVSPPLSMASSRWKESTDWTIETYGRTY
jgi:hypothetical protein